MASIRGLGKVRELLPLDFWSKGDGRSCRQDGILEPEILEVTVAKCRPECWRGHPCECGTSSGMLTGASGGGRAGAEVISEGGGRWEEGQPVFRASKEGSLEVGRRRSGVQAASPSPIWL